jgi:hypothetical protein
MQIAGDGRKVVNVAKVVCITSRQNFVARLERAIGRFGDF